MVKGALLMCKRRPFTTQNMPFYKPLCNLLIMWILQIHKKATSSDYALSYSFENVMQFHKP